jgi:hypothetical protein
MPITAEPAPAPSAAPAQSIPPPEPKAGVFIADEPTIWAVRFIAEGTRSVIESKQLQTTGTHWKGYAVKYSPEQLSAYPEGHPIRVFANEKGLDTVLLEYGGNKPEAGWIVLGKLSEITESKPPVQVPKSITPMTALMGLTIVILAVFALVSFYKGEKKET